MPVSRRTPPAFGDIGQAAWNSARNPIYVFMKWVVQNWSGLPAPHQETHLAGGSDALQTPGAPDHIDLANTAGTPSAGTGPSYAYEDHDHGDIKRDVRVQHAHADVGTRNKLDFVDSATVVFTVTDVGGSDRVEVSAAASGSSSSSSTTPPGLQGDPGEEGPAGPPGAVGAAGATGASGATGAAGADGRPGFDGEDGAEGPPGPTGAAGAAGATGATGATGADGRPGFDGSDGADGDGGPPGVPGAAGAQGVQGAPGFPGDQGDQGDQGPQGEQGDKGGLRYNFNADTGDPGATAVGLFSYNDATIAAVSRIYINDIERSGTNVGDFLASWDDSSSAPPRGHLVVKSNSNAGSIVNVWGIIGAPDIGGYHQVEVAYISGTLPANGEPCVLEFSRTGDAGGGGGGATWTEGEVDFGSTPVYDASFTITDAAITSSSSKVQILESGKAATGRVAGDSAWDSVNFAALPATGSAQVWAKANPGPVVGKRKYQYSVA